MDNPSYETWVIGTVWGRKEVTVVTNSNSRIHPPLALKWKKDRAVPAEVHATVLTYVSNRIFSTSRRLQLLTTHH